ncbi:MAG: hypothetical protein J5598_01220, partial [Clostridia bacterium]|nr:hypothetical protein [Clostridia bacterium]
GVYFHGNVSNERKCCYKYSGDFEDSNKQQFIAYIDRTNEHGTTTPTLTDRVNLSVLNDSKSYPDADKQYVQLYVPFDVFEEACKLIKSRYGKSEGYNNFMKYWARNGNYNWISDYSEYPGGIFDGTHEVIHPWNSSNFWNTYDGTISPIKDAIAGYDVDGKGGTKAFGWKNKTAA